MYACMYVCMYVTARLQCMHSDIKRTDLCMHAQVKQVLNRWRSCKEHAAYMYRWLTACANALGISSTNLCMHAHVQQVRPVHIQFVL
jgi:hypothetical protein